MKIKPWQILGGLSLIALVESMLASNLDTLPTDSTFSFWRGVFMFMLIALIVGLVITVIIIVIHFITSKIKKQEFTLISWGYLLYVLCIAVIVLGIEVYGGYKSKDEQEKYDRDFKYQMEHSPFQNYELPKLDTTQNK